MTTKPIMMVMVAEKNPMSILGPSFRIFRMSQRRSMTKIMAGMIFPRTTLYAALTLSVFCQRSKVAKTMHMKYKITGVGTYLKNVVSLYFLSRDATTPAKQKRKATYAKPFVITIKPLLKKRMI